MNKKKVVIFDFDGTIADSFSVLMEIIAEIIEKEGIAKFSSEQIEKARDLPMREIILQLKISKWKLPFLARRIQMEFAKKIPLVHPVKGMVSALSALKESGYILGVLSSTRKDILEQFIRDNGIDVFSFVHSEKNLFGKSGALKKMAREYSFNLSESFYVGDESRDIDAAKEAGMRMISVGWGFNSKKMLASYAPDFLIDRPEELLSLNL